MSARVIPDSAASDLAGRQGLCHDSPCELPAWDVACRFVDEELQEHRLTRRFAAARDSDACAYMANYLIAGLCIVHDVQIKEISARSASADGPPAEPVPFL